MAEPASQRAFPWEAAMRFGLGELRLAPRDFWAMTPRELAAAMAPTTHANGRPTREWLDAQAALFPDGPPHDGDSDDAIL